MTVSTLLRYLIGNRQAILDLASSRWSLLVGALFVLSAGFAREYDGNDLRMEPWHLALPFGASLVSSLALFCLAWCGQFRKEPRPVFISAYLSFLGLFWMTAPLAWSYAVPYERFLSAVDAVLANLWTLGLVSVWRVALMSRALVVLLNYRPWAAVSVVLLFGDTVALFLLQFVPIPLINIMGGLHLTDSDRLLQEVTIGVLFAGGCSFVLEARLARLETGLSMRNRSQSLSCSRTSSTTTFGGTLHKLIAPRHVSAAFGPIGAVLALGGPGHRLGLRRRLAEEEIIECHDRNEPKRAGHHAEVIHRTPFTGVKSGQTLWQV